MKQLDITFWQLQKAIRRKQKVNLRYDSFFERRIIDIEFCPYYLLYERRAWYVLGMSSLHEEIRTFKLNHIIQLHLSDKRFVMEKEFDLHEYLGRAWSMIKEGRLYNIKLHFLPKVAGNVAEVRWHSTQKVTQNDDGSATVEFRVDGLGEITWWILGYGDQVKVLAPKALRKKVIEVAKNMITINQQL